METETQLYDSTGTLIKKAETPDFDPDFLKGFMQLFGEGNTNIKKITQQPYAHHVWVYSCVHAIAGNLSRLMPVLFNKEEPDKLITEHPALDVMKRPNMMMTGSEFFEAIFLNLLLPTRNTPGGQCFIVPTDIDGEPINLFRGEQPEFLFPLSDETVHPKMDGPNFLGWIYEHPSGNEIFFFADQIIRIRLFNPYDWLLGLSPYSAIAISAIADATSNELASKYMSNSANIGGLLTTDTRLNKAQADGLKDMWQSQYEGFSKAGKTALLHSGLKFEQTSRSLVDLQFKDQKEMNRQEIMAAYGCSNTILGLTQTVNRATAQVEKELFWEDTLIPLSEKLWLAFNEMWIRFIDPKNLVGVFDTSNVAALKKNQSQKIKDASILIDQGVPAAEAYRTVNLVVQTKGLDWLNDPLVKGQRTNLQTGELIGQQTFNDDEPATKGDVRRLSHDHKNEKLSQEDREKLWNDYVEKTLKKPEKDFKEAWTKFLVSQRNSFQDKVDSWLNNQSTKSLIFKVTSSDFLIPKDAQDIALIKMAGPIYEKGIALQVTQMEKELGGLKNFKPSQQVVKSLKDQRIKFLKGINSTTFKRLEKKINIAITEGKAQGLSNVQLARKIKTLQSETFTNKIGAAKTTARTETSAMANSTRMKIMVDEGIDKHEWITQVDDVTRGNKASDQADHLSLNGEVRKLGKQFSNGLTQPLEAGAPAEEVVECRCLTVPVK